MTDTPNDPDRVITVEDSVRYLRRITLDVRELKVRMSAVELRIGQLETSIAGINQRIDRIEARLVDDHA